MMKSTLIASAAAALLALSAHAANAVIVNVSATDPNASESLTLDAGTYDVSWIGIGGGGLYDAWAAKQDGPTGVYSFYRDAIKVSFSDGAVYTSPGSYFGPYTPDTAQSALAYAQANPYSFTLASPETVTFTIPDNEFRDNNGGVSLSVTAAVPEPETYALMLAGLGAMAFVARRRKA